MLSFPTQESVMKYSKYSRWGSLSHPSRGGILYPMCVGILFFNLGVFFFPYVGGWYGAMLIRGERSELDQVFGFNGIKASICSKGMTTSNSMWMSQIFDYIKHKGVVSWVVQSNCKRNGSK